MLFTAACNERRSKAVHSVHFPCSRAASRAVFAISCAAGVIPVRSSSGNVPEKMAEIFASSREGTAGAGTGAGSTVFGFGAGSLRGFTSGAGAVTIFFASGSSVTLMGAGASGAGAAGSGGGATTVCGAW